MSDFDKNDPLRGLRVGVKSPPRPDATFRPLPARNQKRSLAVPLLALGGATLVGLSVLGHGQDVQRNRYGSYEDCVHDYSTGQCEMDTSVSGSGGLHYYGPWYRSGSAGGAQDPGPGRMRSSSGSVASFSAPSTVELGTRGGFGSSGRVSARAS
jgi:hypothetical protein